jgi:hypothetical protein
MSVNDLSNLGIEADASDEVRRISANTEDTALLRQVGLLPRDLDADIWDDAERVAMASKIAANIIGIVGSTRSKLTYVRLNGMLDKSIESALQTVNRPPNGVGGRETVSQVLTQALYDALPKETWHIVTEEAINAAYPVAAERDAAYKFYEKLRTGNDANDMSAGMAVFMAMQDAASSPLGSAAGATPIVPSWESKYVTNANKAGIQAEMSSLQQQKSLYDTAKGFAPEALTLSYRYAANLEELEEDVSNLPLDAAAVGSGTPSWRSRSMTALYAGETPDTLTKPAEQKAKKEAATSLLAEARQDLASYRKVLAQLDALMRRVEGLFANPAVDTPGFFGAYFDAGPPVRVDHAKITPATTSAAIVATLEADLAIGRAMKNGKPFEKETDIQGKMDEETKKLSLAKDAKDVAGTEVQMSVFRAYIKRQQPSLSAADVDQVAKYILNRTKVDGVLRTTVDQSVENYVNVNGRTWTDNISNAAFNWGNGEWTSRVGSTLTEIARSLNIPKGADGPNWQAASYEQASAAYFAIKELMDGKGPKDLSFARRPQQAVQAFTTLSRILSTRYAGQIESNLLKSLSDEEKKDIVKSRARTAKAVNDILLGDTPGWVRSDVDKAHARADRQATWFSRGAYNFTTGSAKTIGTNVGSWLGSGVSGGLSGAKSAVKHYGADAAKIAAFSLLGGPVLGIAAWYAMKHFEKPSSKSA